MLFAADEPIARFLPPAKFAMPDRQERAQDGRAAQVTYTVPDEILKTATPLTTLIKAEIDAFADAVALFLAKARPDAKGVPPYIRQCRQDFRLPDPEIDPSAYWVYGPEFDRRLLILWGCEPQASAALPLEKIVEKLRAREMSWRDVQDLGLKLALQPNEPLARFLAPRAAEGGLVVDRVNVPAKKLRRLKTLPPAEWRAFEAAAKAYYAKAHSDAAGVAPFEKEVRAAFTLASLEKVPGDYYMHGSKLVIALDTWQKDVTVPLTDDAKLQLPPPVAAPSGPAAAVAAGGATVSAQLKVRQQPAWVAYAKIAAALVVAAGAGVGTWWALRPPPLLTLVETQTTDDRTVVLTFSTPVAAATLQAKPAPPEGKAEDPFTFHDNKLKIANRALSVGAPQRVVLQVEGRMVDGEKYGIAIKNLAPLKGRPIAPSNAEFTFNDRVAPKLDKLSAGGKTKKNLLLVFTKPIKEETLTPARFAIYPVDGGQRGKRLNAVGAELDKEDKTGLTVMLEASDDFVGGKTYVIDITGVTDRAVKANPVEEKTAQNREFTYVNLLPPRLGEVVASGGRFTIDLIFNTPVDPKIAQDEANYTLSDPEKKPLRLLKGGIKIDDAGTTVSLKLEPQRLSGGQHQLVVAKMADRQGNTTAAPLERPFAFNDASDRKAPTVKAVEGAKPTVVLNDRTIRLQFDRALEAETAGNVARYRIFDNDRQTMPIQSASVATDDPSRVVLQLAREFSKPGKYFVETNGLLNVFGVAQLSPEVKEFNISGTGITAASLIDWAKEPVLNLRTQLLTLAIRPRVAEASARVLANYSLDPDTIKIEKVEKFVLGTDEDRVTVITLKLATPTRESFTISAQNLMLEGRMERGPQSLKPRQTQVEP
jgi:hypothetical protein